MGTIAVRQPGTAFDPRAVTRTATHASPRRDVRLLEPGQLVDTPHARLRYRLQESTLKLSYRLVRPEQVMQDAFGDVLAAIHDGTGLVPLLGTYGG